MNSTTPFSTNPSIFSVEPFHDEIRPSINDQPPTDLYINYVANGGLEMQAIEIHEAKEEDVSGAHEKKCSSDDPPDTPRPESRREGFDLGLDDQEEVPKEPCRNPLGPERQKIETPPPLAEIIRQMTGQAPQNVAHDVHGHSVSVEPTTGPTLPPYTEHDETASPSDVRRSSIAAFAKGVARHVPMGRIPSISVKAAENTEVLHRSDSQDFALLRGSRRERKSSVALIPVMKSTKVDKPASAFAIHPDKPILNSQMPSPAPRANLRDRRKVKLDLSLPSDLPDLPFRTRPPPGTLSSTTPSCPLSPGTPWVRREKPNWDMSRLLKSAPIMEEEVALRPAIKELPGRISGLLPDNDPIKSSMSPQSEASLSIYRNGGVSTRPRYNRRSRSTRSGTSDPLLSPPLIEQPPLVDPQVLRNLRAQKERQLQIAHDLEALTKSTAPSRRRRWRWGASSEETTSEPTNRRFSLNFFKRSSRLSSKTVEQHGRQPSNTLDQIYLGRDTPTAAADLTLFTTNIAAPPPFIPPGLQRVPTPPIFDADGEVKGKLAGFFFDVHGSGVPRRRVRASPGSVWDSDALLMDLSSDIPDHDEEEEDEGPGGPMVSRIHFGFDKNGIPDPHPSQTHNYLTVKMPDGRLDTSLSPSQGQHGWIGAHRISGSPDEQMLAQKEEDDRWKFDWLVPEHLPTSPLCPLHSKYRGSYKGTCYWHDGKKMRSRASSMRGMRVEPANMNGSGNAVYGRSWTVADKQHPRSEQSKRWSGQVELVPSPDRAVKRHRLASLVGN